MRYTQPANQQSQQAEVFDFEKALVDLKERFARNLWMLGHSNDKGTYRYDFEVDFCYLSNELQRGPLYSRSKRYEQLNGLINSVINFGKVQRGRSAITQNPEAVTTAA